MLSSHTYFFFFFFKESAPPRPLPSSPPRRSPAPAQPLPLPHRGGVGAEAVAAVDHQDVPRDPLQVHGPIERRVAPAHEQHAAQDRKSTRLNSSHDQISYAVFCLKKKNN